MILNKVKETDWFLIGGLAIVFVATGLWLLLFLVVLFAKNTDLEFHGQRGDAFGALNALFSGFSLLGVILAIHYQRLELKEQREEIKQSRIAQQETANALGEQSKFARMQAEIEGFKLISQLLKSEIDSLETKTTFNPQEQERRKRETMTRHRKLAICEDVVHRNIDDYFESMWSANLNQPDESDEPSE